MRVLAGPEIVEEGGQEEKNAEEEPIDDSRQIQLLSESMRGLVNSQMFRLVRRHSASREPLAAAQHITLARIK